MDIVEYLALVIAQSTHPAPNVSEEPVFEMDHWSVFEVVDDGKCHQFLVGCRLGENYGRLSTPVQQWNLTERTAGTRSGRLYRLHGPPGRHPDAMWVWQRSAGSVPYSDVSQMIWQKMQRT